MVGINVYLFDKKLESLFEGCSDSKNTYSLSITSYDKSKDSRNKIKLTNFNCIEDRFIWECLSDCDPDAYSLICLDKLVSNCSTNTIYNCFEYLIENVDFDIFYAASWADRCDLYSDVHEIENYKIVKTYSPHGTSCLLFSPHGRKKFLEKINPTRLRSLDFTINSQMDLFEVYTTMPSLVEFDITKRESDLEYVKLCKCREVPNMVRPIEVERRNTTTLNLFWFILVLIIIICIAAILLSIADNVKITSLKETITNNNLSLLSYKQNMNPYPPYDPLGDLGTYKS